MPTNPVPLAAAPMYVEVERTVLDWVTYVLDRAGAA